MGTLLLHFLLPIADFAGFTHASAANKAHIAIYVLGGYARRLMDMGTDSDLIRSAPIQDQNGARRRPSIVGVVLDVLRPRDGSLRILEAADEGDGLALTSSVDEIVSVGDLGRNGAAGRFEEDAFDCAVATEMVHRLDPADRQALLARLRQAARGVVLVEAPRSTNGRNPLEEAIELFREFGDSVLVLSEEHLPALLTLREAGLAANSNGSSANGGAQQQPIAQHLLAPYAGSPRSLLVSIVDSDAEGIDVTALQWCCSPPAGSGRDPAGLAVLPLSLEVRRLSDRLEGERVRGARAEAVAADLRTKVAELTRIASEDRAARESAEELVEIVAASRGYRIGLAICRARAALWRRAGSAWRMISAPWRSLAARFRQAPPPASGP
jgi:hypothetical protein